MKHITRWSPDTCGCSFEYEWDDELPEAERNHTVVSVPNKCEHHAHHEEKHAHFSTIIDENGRKNKLHADIIKNFPHLTKTDEEGNTVLKIDAFKWNFDKDRILHVEIKGLNNLEKSSFQAMVDKSHGQKKVKVK